MRKSQIIFNGKKSLEDFELYLVNVEVGYPSPRQIKTNVPYQNGYYDFTELYEDNVYDNRTINITFEYLDILLLTQTRLNSVYGHIADWLFGAGENKLYIDYEYGYFTARAINITPIEIFWQTGRITVEFDCYPFRMYDEPEGNDLWDPFNFELDYFITTGFTVNGELDVILHNYSAIRKTPTIKCDGNIKVIKDGVTYDFMPGTWHDWRFMLNRGENKVKLIGKGNIEFIYYREVI